MAAGHIHKIHWETLVHWVDFRKEREEEEKRVSKTRDTKKEHITCTSEGIGASYACPKQKDFRLENNPFLRQTIKCEKSSETQYHKVSNGTKPCFKCLWTWKDSKKISKCANSVCLFLLHVMPQPISRVTVSLLNFFKCMLKSIAIKIASHSS